MCRLVPSSQRVLSHAGESSRCHYRQPRLQSIPASLRRHRRRMAEQQLVALLHHKVRLSPTSNICSPNLAVIPQIDPKGNYWACCPVRPMSRLSQTTAQSIRVKFPPWLWFIILGYPGLAGPGTARYACREGHRALIEALLLAC
ncbi:hypothetical protein CCHR01_16498 [Colletotrichum chrysophilum]|uniref:Uncharacterized protein n=1 Tax=Colletotrichum chrysophilum TaxID=1836956 RepID=A0AAD9A8C3_9PEZI|nr:hypothetical protein CCHR01_16498 [Colletotrichum chrysophilum]